MTGPVVAGNDDGARVGGSGSRFERNRDCRSVCGTVAAWRYRAGVALRSQHTGGVTQRLKTPREGRPSGVANGESSNCRAVDLNGAKVEISRNTDGRTV